MASTSTLNVRIQDELKTDAAEILMRYGLTLSDAVRIFLSSVVTKQGLPPELVMDEDQYQKWLSERLERSFKDRAQSRSVDEFLKDF